MGKYYVHIDAVLEFEADSDKEAYTKGFDLAGAIGTEDWNYLEGRCKVEFCEVYDDGIQDDLDKL